MPKRILNIRGQQPTPRPKRVSTSLLSASADPVWKTYEFGKHTLVRFHTDLIFDNAFLDYYRLVRSSQSVMDFCYEVTQNSLFELYGTCYAPGLLMFMGEEDHFQVSHFRVTNPAGSVSMWKVHRQFVTAFDEDL